MNSTKEPAFSLPSLNFKSGQEDQISVTNDKIEYLDKYDPLVFCRTCANMDTCLVPIFKDEGLNYNLNKKIEKYLPIHVTQEDDLPVHLCYHCASTLVAWDTLIIGCVEAEKKLNFLKHSFRSRQADNIIEVSESLPNEVIDSDDEPLISKKNNKGITDSKKTDDQRSILQEKNDFQTQLDPSSVEPERLISEQKRKEICSLETAIKAVNGGGSAGKQVHCGKRVLHSVNKQLNTYCKRNKKKEVSNNGSNKCPSCQKSFSNVSSHLNHLYGHTNKDLETVPIKSNKPVCQICKEIYETVEELIKHVHGHVNSTLEKIKKQNTDSLSSNCEVCGKVVSRKYAMKRHMATHTGERKFTCHRCGKQYAQESGLQRHVSIIHEGVRKYKCPICSSIFGSNGDLKSHQHTHTDPRPFQCDQCGRTFTSQKHLYHHRKYHHSGNGMRRLCKVCNTYFSSASVLKRHHKVVHLGLKEFQCHVCSTQLTTKHYLQEHLKLHSNERQEVCTLCGKAFQMSGNLRQHMKTHMGKTHMCHVCGKGFTRRCQLLVHMGSHKGVESPQCKLCHRVFLLKDDLDKHTKKDKCNGNGGNSP